MSCVIGKQNAGHMGSYIAGQRAVRSCKQGSGQEEGVRIANFLCNGNYAVSGGLPGCEVGCLMLLASPVQEMLSMPALQCIS